MWSKPKIAVKLKTPHSEQAKFIDSSAKRKVLRAGRRAGKTSACAILGLKRFLEGKHVLYCAPTEEQTGAFWSEVKGALGRAVYEGVFLKNETERFVELAGTGQRIKATTSWDPDSLRSDYADLLILDEYQLQDPRVWSEVGAPMMLDTDGDCVFVYTPPSLHSRAISKASDPRHAAKLFKMASLDKTGRWAAFHFTSHDNPHISKQALEDICLDMTRLAYLQEIEAQDVEQVQGALWTQKIIDENRVDTSPELRRIVIAIDPSGSGNTGSDECGIIVAGVGQDGEGYILKDLSGRMSPEKWATVAVGAYHEFKADRIVAEQNFGGEMVRVTLQSVDPNVPYKSVSASRGKLVRAEPVSALYDRKKIHHVGMFPELEDELCTYTGTGASPGRLDALVWAATELVLGDTQTLGWIEYLKKLASGLIHDVALERSDTPAPATPTFAIQPVVTQRPSLPPCQESPGACPVCGSRCVVRASVAGGLHCNACSHNFGPAKVPVVFAGFGPDGRPGIFQR
jgi:hypothetical protein